MNAGDPCPMCLGHQAHEGSSPCAIHHQAAFIAYANQHAWFEPYTPPKIPDELNVPLTRRDLLFAIQQMPGEEWQLLWERLTVAWRQPDVHQPSPEGL
ncbi:MAG TPA: hypothetical protein VN513_15390 [Gemmatimonadales bacterium]|nr:hypothetical protein [Gemmatimonadales bacterium]